ncbi:hypothetical protein D7X96_07750 [Corallococcus interemptor]|uniref:Uncharacterized protein n=1 Tax=Corallococcus interemptor TaxID=2316720 RepID=A0A3A8QS65_9BACT|nr:hypothetical protein [Corallococcus interemptor]RKH71619.1 hypothetical protein D7X96_07750 [Corallococcus interemptor]
MGILGYQLAIIAVLIGVRLVAPQRLLGAALTLTALSIVNLFWPPLIVLQLFTVWGTYRAIAPSAATPEKGKPARVTELLGSVNSFIDGLNTAVDELGADVALKRAIQEATLGLQSGYNIERDGIQSVMESSKERLLADRRRLALSEAGRASFEAKKAELTAAIEKALSESGESVGKTYRSPPQIALTDLTAPVPHENPEVAAAAQRHHASLVREYSKFLADVVARLQREKELRAIFETEMNALAPALLWRIECFEAGGDWQSVASVERARSQRRVP